MNIDDMPAGREMDVLVAERVFGFAVDHEFDMPRVKQLRDKYDEFGVLPNYSTDIGAAWEVVDKIAEIIRSDVYLGALSYPSIEQGGIGHWCVTWGLADADDEEWIEHPSDFPATAGANSASLAICRAALKAITSAPARA